MWLGGTGGAELDGAGVGLSATDSAMSDVGDKGFDAANGAEKMLFLAPYLQTVSVCRFSYSTSKLNDDTASCATCALLVLD